MKDKIDKFAGDYRWLSNFWYVDVEYEGVTYPTTEHAFQAAKTLNLGQRRHVRKAASPGEAKKLGRQVTLRTGWDGMKDEVMLDLNRQKFRDAALRKKLLETGDAPLIEGNTWNDRYWGVCRGTGKNRLGQILMRIRSEIRQETT
jgi:ribA/ribD-fused uncharacterized protein